MFCSHLPPPDLPDPLRLGDAHLTETVLLLARGIAADLGFDRLPILADALEDAGCDNLALLTHLRSGEPHRVECWALRRLLRTTLMLPGGVPMTFAYCPPGTFLMGSPDTGLKDQQQHEVRLTRGFYTGIHPVTQAQWGAVMGSHPSHFKGEVRPVETVSWDDAQEFCRKVRELTARQTRLPTEAEWEYACRGGTTTPYYWGEDLDGTQANCDGTFATGGGVEGPYLRATSAVGCYAVGFPHPWGLADVHGNIWEWCADWFDAGFYTRSPSNDPECCDGERKFRILRGGSWDSFAWNCDAAHRRADDAAARNQYFGFRVVFTA